MGEGALGSGVRVVTGWVEPVGAPSGATPDPAIAIGLVSYEKMVGMVSPVIGVSKDFGWLIALIVPLAFLTLLTVLAVFRANRRMEVRIAQREATGIDPREACVTVGLTADPESALATAETVLGGLRLKYGTEVHKNNGVRELQCQLSADWRSWLRWRRRSRPQAGDCGHPIRAIGPDHPVRRRPAR